jgi:transcriptional regulator with XRE-family HTH domain
MSARHLLRDARRRARLTQRELARRTGVAQPTVARIEAGQNDPRVATLERLLAACGESLASIRRPGAGVDRSQFWELLRLEPIERLELLRADVAAMRRLEEAARR